MEKISPGMEATGGISRNSGSAEEIRVSGHYSVECVKADGTLRWKDEVQNLVTTVGKNLVLDTVIAGASYTAAWYLGLVDGAAAPTYSANDSAASHEGWIENTAYSNSGRPAPSWGAASAGSKASSAVSFNINAYAVLAGCFLINNATKGGTSGVLYSCGSFAGGNKAVSSGDTLNVTYTATA